MWVSHTDSSGGFVTKLRASDGVVLGIFPANGAWGLAFDGTNILVANRGFGTITKLRASDGQFQGFYVVDPEPEFLTVVKGDLWAGFNHADTVQEIRLSDGVLLGTFPVGRHPLGIAFDGTNIWVANAADFTISILSARDGSLVATIPTPRKPHHLVRLGNEMWTTLFSGARASAFGVHNHVEKDHFVVGDKPEGITTDGSAIWVANSGDDTVTKLSFAP